MDIQHKNNGVYSTLLLAGRLDATSAAEAEQKIGEIINGGAANLLLDLTKLEFISSAGLRVLLVTAKKLLRQNGKLALCGLQDTVRIVFEVSGFLSIFQIAGDAAEAAKFFEKT
ncbi:MAG: STAS domain-containing protein [bacterium]